MSKNLTRQAAVACAALGLLAACSSSKSLGSGTTDSAVPTTQLAITVPATVAPTTVPDSIPVPTIPPTPTCSDVTEPSADALQLTVIDGDWNGDGNIDLGYSWAEPIGSTVKWFVRAEVSGGESSTVALGDLGASYAQALDGVDVDFALGADPGVNSDELLAVVGGGASGLNLGIFGFDAADCLFRFDDGTGASFIVPVAASTGQLSGLICDGAAGSQFLVELTAASEDGVNWQTVDFRIDREGERSLVLGSALPGTLLASDAGLGAYSHAQCGGTVWI